jgi:hypothetical protein
MAHAPIRQKNTDRKKKITEKSMMNLELPKIKSKVE